VWTRVHREHFRDDPKNFDFRKPGEIFVRAYAEFVRAKSEKLLSANTLESVQASLLAEV
jgi:fructose-bisphosphate aldolase class II